MGEPRDVLITGIGLVTPLAIGREESWRGLAAGRRAAGWCRADLAAGNHLADQDARYAGAASPLRAHSGAEDDPLVLQALLAAQEALADARLELGALDRDRVGCVIGSSKGGVASFHAGFRAERLIAARGQASRQDFWNKVPPDAAARAVAARFDLRAFALCPVAACATGLVSVARAAELIAQGQCDVALAGSTDASLVPVVLASFDRMGVLARGFDEPAGACRPFDERRNGFVVGEGAAVLVLEHSERASARGARPYARWLSGRILADPTHLARLESQPYSLARLLTESLRAARVAPDEVDYVNLHGTATRANDLAETRAVKQALAGQARRVASSSLKGAIGHLLGAAGSVELAATLLAMRDGLVPPTANLHVPDAQCDLDYTPREPRARRIETAVKLSLGFGGHLACAVLRAEPGAIRGASPPTSSG
jgi:3-oxoacyl-[acyl-carrier-protein] synthase II